MTTPLIQLKLALDTFIKDNVAQKRYDICTNCDEFTLRDNRCKISNCDMVEVSNKLEYKCPINKFDSVRLDL